MNIHETLQNIFREVFNDKSLVITAETTAEDIEDWDSLAQITLIAASESAFGVKFEIEEIVALSDVGGMLALIERKRSEAGL